MKQFRLFRKIIPFLIALGLIASLAPVTIANAAQPEPAVVSVPALNLRTGPALDRPILRVLPAGTRLTILGVDPSGQWSQVRLADNVEGYVYTQYLQSPSSSASQALVDNLNLRIGPGTQYRVLRMIAKGQELEVTGRNKAGDWLQVNLADGAQGWVFSPYVLMDAPVSSLPNVEAYGGPQGSGQPANSLKVVVTIRDNRAVVAIQGFPASKDIVAELGLPGKDPDLKVATGATAADGTASLAFDMPAHWSDGSRVSQQNLALNVHTQDNSYSVAATLLYYR